MHDGVDASPMKSVDAARVKGVDASRMKCTDASPMKVVDALRMKCIDASRIKGLDAEHMKHEVKCIDAVYCICFCHLSSRVVSSSTSCSADSLSHTLTLACMISLALACSTPSLATPVCMLSLALALLHPCSAHSRVHDLVPGNNSGC